MPRASARSAARRITGPSASGSEKGKPSSTMSAPPSTAAAASSGVSGSDMRYTTRVFTAWPPSRSRDTFVTGPGPGLAPGWCSAGSRARLQGVQRLRQILVAPAAEADEDQLFVELAGPRERVGRLEGGDDALRAREL